MGRIDWFGWLRAGSPQENSPAQSKTNDLFLVGCCSRGAALFVLVGSVELIYWRVMGGTAARQQANKEDERTNENQWSWRQKSEMGLQLREKANQQWMEWLMEWMNDCRSLSLSGRAMEPNPSAQKRAVSQAKSNQTMRPLLCLMELVWGRLGLLFFCGLRAAGCRTAPQREKTSRNKPNHPLALSFLSFSFSISILFHSFFGGNWGQPKNGKEKQFNFIYWWVMSAERHLRRKTIQLISFSSINFISFFGLSLRMKEKEKKNESI